MASVTIQGGRSKELIVGIDLGTTNSLAAVVRDGKPVVLDAREGGHLVPSVVSFVDGELRVGARARPGRLRDPRHTVFSVKRLLGRGVEELAALGLPYPIVRCPMGAASVVIGGRFYTAVEISALILKEVKAGAEKALGQPVRKAVVTVPAYFNDSQRQATRAAGRLAGLDVLRIVNEPTAAALAYGLDRRKQGLIAVYDLGGGTFDISILKLHDGIFEVLATGGDTQLGGDDLDGALARELAAGWGLAFDGAAIELRARLLEAAERAKIALASGDEAEAAVDWEGRRLSRRVSRFEFDRLALPVLERTRAPCLAALKDAGVRAEDLSDVVVVGGPTRLGVVRKLVHSIFEREPDVSVHPDEVVAEGAAIQADILAGGNRELLLLDVIPLSLGIETYGGVMSPLLTRNTRVPAVARETFTTFADNQTGVDIHVLQGEREKAGDNRSLARFKLAGLPPQPAGSPRVEVTFLVDADGILEVSARDLKTGNAQAVEVRPSFGLSDAEIDRMLRSSAEFAEADVAYRQLVESRNEAEPVLRASERALSEATRLLSEPEAAGIRRDVDRLRAAFEGSDPDAIRAASQSLGRSTERLAELIVNEALKGATSARS